MQGPGGKLGTACRPDISMTHFQLSESPRVVDTARPPACTYEQCVHVRACAAKCIAVGELKEVVDACKDSIWKGEEGRVRWRGG